MEYHLKSELTGTDLNLIWIERGHEYTRELCRKMVKLEDAEVKKRLIELGWAPPEEVKELKSQLEELGYEMRNADAMRDC